DKTSSAKVLKGEASYYANKFQGRRTANGEKYDKKKLTAAHKTLKFDTRVEVLNLKNNKKVIVRINDRLPASSKREIDLSRAAAEKIDMIQAGVVPVQIRILE
ncbi:MAG: septal ring lytic transglycosylase RlpA family protein, partial [Bacteroidota bacterium]